MSAGLAPAGMAASFAALARMKPRVAPLARPWRNPGPRRLRRSRIALAPAAGASAMRATVGAVLNPPLRDYTLPARSSCERKEAAMETIISDLLTRFEKGSLNRRELVSGLAMLAGGAT